MNMTDKIKSNSLNSEALYAEEIWFGSDQEKALTNAIDFVFPGGKRKLCYLHLRENLIHYMRVI